MSHKIHFNFFSSVILRERVQIHERVTLSFPTSLCDDDGSNSNSSGSSADNTPLIAGLVVGVVAFLVGAVVGYLYKIGKIGSNHGDGRFASYNFHEENTTTSYNSPRKSGMSSMQTVPSTEIADEHEIFTL